MRELTPEHFQQCCSDAAKGLKAAVFLTFMNGGVAGFAGAEERQIGEWVGRKKAQKDQKMRRRVVAGAAADVVVSIVRFDPNGP